MSHPPLSAQQLYDAGPLGALVRFSDGAVEPPQRHVAFFKYMRCQRHRH